MAKTPYDVVIIRPEHANTKAFIRFVSGSWKVPEAEIAKMAGRKTPRKAAPKPLATAA